MKRIMPDLKLAFLVHNQSFQHAHLIGRSQQRTGKKPASATCKEEKQKVRSSLRQFHLFIQRFKLPQRMSVQRQLDKRAKNLSTWFITSIHLFFLSSPKHKQPFKLFNNFSLALPDLVISLDTNYSLHCPSPKWFFPMGNVPHLWKDKRWSLHFPSHLLELTHFMTFFLTLLIDQLPGENCVQSCPFFLLITLWSKLLCKDPYSHRIFHRLHVLHTLLIFSITFWQK